MEIDYVRSNCRIPNTIHNAKSKTKKTSANKSSNKNDHIFQIKVL